MRERVRRSWATPLLALALTLGLSAVAVTPAAASGGLVLSTTPAPPSGAVGVGYSYNFSANASGGSGTFTAWAVVSGSVPAGLLLNSSTGLLSGTPSTASTSNFTLQVTDSSSNTATAAFSITIAKSTASQNSWTPSPNPSAQGQLVTYSDFVVGLGGVTPTGTITFTSNPPGSLPAGVLCIATLSAGNGSCTTNATPNSGSTGPQTDTITATYSGDANYIAQASPPTAAETVEGTGTGAGQAIATTTVDTTTPTSTTYGSSVNYQATVNATSGPNAPTGTVTFTTSSGGITLCTGAISGTSASCSSSAAPAGTDTITATYNGAWNTGTNSGFAGSTGTVSLAVALATTSTAMTLTPTSSTWGQSVNYAATVTPPVGNPTPTGTVQFTIGGVTMCSASLSSGSASCNSVAAPVGSDTVAASYLGSSNYLGSSTSSPFVVSKATTTTTISASPSTPSFGASVLYSATITVSAPGGGAVSGTVTFTDGATTLCAAPISAGAGSCSKNTAPVGSGQTVTGSFAATTDFLASSGTTALSVSQATTNVMATATPSSAALGTTISFGATVTSSGGTPTGTVNFETGGGLQLCGPATLSSGAASCTSNKAQVGSNSVVAVYSGDTNFSGNAGFATLTTSQGVVTTMVSAMPSSDDFDQTVTFTATETSPGSTTAAGPPTGTVAISTNGGSTALCMVTLSGGTGTCTAANAPVGNDTINALYSGDTNYLTSSGTTTLDVVNPDPTVTDASVTPTSVELDQSVNYQATVTPTPPGTVTGTVTFSIGGTTICAASVGAANLASCSATTAPIGAAETVKATYAATLNFGGSSDTTPLTVTTDATSTALSVTTSPIAFGSSDSYGVTVTNTVGAGPTPTGSVVVKAGSTQLCVISSLSAGSGSCTSVLAPTGTDSLTATFTPTGGSVAGSSGTSTVTVNKAATTTTPGVAPTSVIYGDTVTYSATVTSAGGTPSGTVAFTDGATALCTETLGTGPGSGPCTAVNAPAGSDTITATYSGDANFATSSATAPLTVGTVGTTTMASVAPTSVSFGTTVTYSATVTSPGGTPTGTVAFTDGATALCTETLSAGGGSCPATDAPLGTDTITATYNGDGNFVTSSATTSLTVTVASSTTTPMVTPNPTTFGSTVTYSANVTSAGGTPSGTVAFTDGALALCTETLGSGPGQGSCTASNAPSSVDTITATYSGNANFTGSNGTTTLTVNNAPTATTAVVAPTSTIFGGTVTYSSAVTSAGGTPTGTVAFTDGATALCTETLGSAPGDGSCTASTAPIGNPDTITATYSGDTNFVTSNHTTTLTVAQDATTTTPNLPSTATYLSTVTYGATVTSASGTPTGTVTFVANPGAVALCTATLSAGTGSCPASTAPVGSDTVVATYNGDGTFATSTQSTALSITKVPTTTTVGTTPASSTFGQSVTYSATVASSGGGDSGTVAITDGTGVGAVALCMVTLSAGSGTCTSNAAPAGSDTIFGAYSGDATSATSTSAGTALTVSSVGTTTTPSAGSGSAVFGQNVTYSATVTSSAGTPTGTVAFTIGSTPLCTATLSTGSGSCTSSIAPVGSDTVTAAYSGDANHSTSSQIASLAEAKAATATALGGSPNPGTSLASITYTATVSVVAPGAGTPTGSVSFLSGGVGIAACSGANAVPVVSAAAACTVTGPNPATYAITATFTPDGASAVNFNGSTSSQLSEVVNAASTTTTMSTAPSAVVIGGGVTYSATVTSAVATPTGSVTFSTGATTLCSTGLSGGTGSCGATTAPLSPSDPVIATYAPGLPAFGPSTSATSVLSVGPAAPAAPSGATASSGAPSPSPSGSATATVPTGSAVGNGYGALTLSTLPANPETAALPASTGAFDQLSLDPASLYSSVVLSICGLGTGHSLDYWTGSAWAPLPGQSLSVASGCIAVTLSASSTPSLTGLTSLVVAVSQAQGPEAGKGYWLVAADGGIFGFGDAKFFGSTGALHLNQPIVGMAAAPDSQGYWLVATDGGIFSFGSAGFFGSTGAIHLNQPIVGMNPTPDGKGYWLVAADGGIFAFGDAKFFGSTGAIHLNQPIVGMESTPDGKGYWLVASDGGIFAFGDAKFFGSTGAIHLNQPIVALAATPDGAGYWMVASDGGIFAFGDAKFFGSTGAIHLNRPIVGMARTPDGGGYWLVASDGGIFGFGDATFYGSAGSTHLNQPIVTMAEG